MRACPARWLDAASKANARARSVRRTSGSNRRPVKAPRPYLRAVRSPSGFREGLYPGGEAARDLPLVGARLQTAALERVRHEPGLDEDRGHVRPVEAGQVAAAHEP